MRQTNPQKCGNMLENTSQVFYQRFELACGKGQEEDGRKNRMILGPRKNCAPVATFVHDGTDLASL